MTLPQPAHFSAGIGTPHARWREMHQSGRDLDHVADPIARPRRNPVDRVDFGERPFAQSIMIDAQEPLLGRDERSADFCIASNADSYA